VFRFINNTLSTSAGDFLWPLITDYDKILPVRVVLIAVWGLLIWKGGVRGRTAALLIILVIIAADQLSSSVIKELVGRPRPCHFLNGVTVVPDVHLIVSCGSGKSFPSSHAVNNFALASLLAFYYRRWQWWFFSWAAVVAISRVAVGVHYPSDIVGGALLGAGLGSLSTWFWTRLQERYFPRLAMPPTKELAT